MRWPAFLAGIWLGIFCQTPIVLGAARPGEIPCRSPPQAEIVSMDGSHLIGVGDVSMKHEPVSGDPIIGLVHSRTSYCNRYGIQHFPVGLDYLVSPPHLARRSTAGDLPRRVFKANAIGLKDRGAFPSIFEFEVNFWLTLEIPTQLIRGEFPNMQIWSLKSALCVNLDRVRPIRRVQGLLTNSASPPHLNQVFTDVPNTNPRENARPCGRIGSS